MINEKDKAIVIVVDKASQHASDAELLGAVKLFVNGSEYKDFGRLKFEVGPYGYKVEFGFTSSSVPQMWQPADPRSGKQAGVQDVLE